MGPFMDDYFELINKHWDNILAMYCIFQHKKPVMVFHAHDLKIFSYPYQEFLESLNPRSQAMLKMQYEEAISQNKMVLFVRDNEKRKLKSMVLPLQRNISFVDKDNADK